MANTANVGFLWGSKENLEKIKKKALELSKADTEAAKKAIKESDSYQNVPDVQEGAFYFTKDSNRLYVGQNGLIAPVNGGIISADAIGAFPTNKDDIEDGAFYYAKAENIFCIYNGNKWVQINPDTYEYYQITDISNSVEAHKITEDVPKDPEDQNNTETVTKNAGLYINTTITETRYDKTGNEVENDEQIVDSKADSEIFISQDNLRDALNLQIDLKSETVTPTTEGEKKKVQIKLSGDGFSSTKDGTPITLESSGWSTISQEDNTITLKNPKSGEFIYDVETGLGLALTDSGNTTVATIENKKTDGSYENLFYYEVGTKKVNGETVTKKIYNQENLLTYFYDKDQIDDKLGNIGQQLTGLNALVYRGTVNSSGEGATFKYADLETLLGEQSSQYYDISSGYSYLIADSFKLSDNTEVNTGDLLIATAIDTTDENDNVISGENDDGKIKKDHLKWTVVPSGDDIDTHYIFSTAETTAENDGVIYLDSYAGSSGNMEAVSQITFIKKTTDKIENEVSVNNPISVKVTEILKEEDEIPETEISVSHDIINVIPTEPTTTDNDTFISYISGIEYDNYGHITGYTVKENKVEYNFSDSIEKINNKNTIQIEQSLQDIKKNEVGSSIYNLTSDTLQLNYTEAVLETDETTEQTIVKTPQTISVDLVWGTF